MKENVTMTSAYQIFEDSYAQDCIFVEVKAMWRQAVCV